MLDLPGSIANIARLISALGGLPTNKPPRPLAVGYGQIQIQYHRGSSGNENEAREDRPMAELLDSKDVVEFKELLMANTIQIDTMYQLLIQKGYFTEAEFLEKMKEVSVDYRLGGKA